jgi:prepilin-type processing-associated H-X9-DG protein
MKSVQLLVCPSYVANTNTYYIPNPGGTGTVPVSYAPTVDNGAVSGANWGAFGDNAGVSLAAFPSVAETIAVVERANNTTIDIISGADKGAATPTSGNAPDADQGVGNHHLDTAVYLFADGHVKALKRPSNPAAGDQTGANATLNGVRYYYWWRSGVANK